MNWIRYKDLDLINLDKHSCIGKLTNEMRTYIVFSQSKVWAFASESERDKVYDLIIAHMKPHETR